MNYTGLMIRMNALPLLCGINLRSFVPKLSHEHRAMSSWTQVEPFPGHTVQMNTLNPRELLSITPDTGFEQPSTSPAKSPRSPSINSLDAKESGRTESSTVGPSGKFATQSPFGSTVKSLQAKEEQETLMPRI